MENKSNKGIICLVVIILLLIGIIAYLLFGKNNNKSLNGENSTTTNTTTQVSIDNNKNEVIITADNYKNYINDLSNYNKVFSYDYEYNSLNYFTDNGKTIYVGPKGLLSLNNNSESLDAPYVDIYKYGNKYLVYARFESDNGGFINIIDQELNVLYTSDFDLTNFYIINDNIYYGKVNCNTMKIDMYKINETGNSASIEFNLDYVGAGPKIC